jgi:hypothetical protein
MEAKTLHNTFVYFDNAASPGGNFRWIDAVGAHVVKAMEDGVVFNVDDTTGHATAYTTTAVSAGAGDSIVAQSNVAGGALVFTSAANEDDGIQIQLGGESFKFDAAYPLYFGIRWKAGDVDQSDFLAGLCITDTTLLGGMSDGARFESVDGTGAVTLEIEKDSTASSLAVGTMTDGAYMILEFYWDGTTLSAWVDGVQTAAVTVTNLPDDEELTLSIAFLTGEAVANTLTVDWVRAFQIRQ